MTDPRLLARQLAQGAADYAPAYAGIARPAETDAERRSRQITAEKANTAKLRRQAAEARRMPGQADMFG